MKVSFQLLISIDEAKAAIEIMIAARGRLWPWPDPLWRRPQHSEDCDRPLAGFSGIQLVRAFPEFDPTIEQAAEQGRERVGIGMFSSDARQGRYDVIVDQAKTKVSQAAIMISCGRNTAHRPAAIEVGQSACGCWVLPLRALSNSWDPLWREMRGKSFRFRAKWNKGQM